MKYSEAVKLFYTCISRLTDELYKTYHDKDGIKSRIQYKHLIRDLYKNLSNFYTDHVEIVGSDEEKRNFFTITSLIRRYVCNKIEDIEFLVYLQSFIYNNEQVEKKGEEDKK